MQSPLNMQALAQVRAASGPLPDRAISMMPEMTATGSAAAIPAGATVGQTSTHLPQRVQASSICSTRLENAASKAVSVIGPHPSRGYGLWPDEEAPVANRRLELASAMRRYSTGFHPTGTKR